jgi:hypothetical protein
MVVPLGAVGALSGASHVTVYLAAAWSVFALVYCIYATSKPHRSVESHLRVWFFCLRYHIVRRAPFKHVSGHRMSRSKVAEVDYSRIEGRIGRGISRYRVDRNVLGLPRTPLTEDWTMAERWRRWRRRLSESSSSRQHKSTKDEQKER